MIPLRSMRSLYGSVIGIYLLILPTLISLLDKYFMLTLGSIRSLRFHTWNYGIVIFMLIIMLPKMFSLLDKYFMLLFGSIRSLQSYIWNYGIVIVMLLLRLSTTLSLLHTLLFIFKKRVVLLFILWIIWLYSITIKTFKCILIKLCWSKYYLLLVLILR